MSGCKGCQEVFLGLSVCCTKCEHLQLEDVRCEHKDLMHLGPKQWDVPEVIETTCLDASSKVELLQSMQMPSSVITCSVDSQYQVSENILEQILPSPDVFDAKLGAVSSSETPPMLEEPDYDDVLALFEQMNALTALEKESLDVKYLAENIQRESPEYEDLRNLDTGFSIQEGEYYDALSSWPDIGDAFGNAKAPYLDYLQSTAELCENIEDLSVSSLMYEESLTMTRLPATQSPIDAEHLAKDGIRKKSLGHAPAAQSEATGKGLQEKILMGFVELSNLMGSGPIFPASAADLSVPKVESISVMGNSLDVSAMCMACTCAINGSHSSCRSCSHLSKVEKKGTFVRSLSFSRRRTIEGPNMGFLVLALLGIISAFFWLLLAGGTWKLFWGIYRLIYSYLSA